MSKSITGPILNVVTTIFLPEWSATAIICEGGMVYIQLLAGRYITKQEVRGGILGFGCNEDFYRRREQLFDEVRARYLEI